jgi:type VI secretion system secreted protein Hcp
MLSRTNRLTRSAVVWLLAFLLLAALVVWRGQAATPLSATRASAAGATSSAIFVTMVGAKQGQFKGETTQKGEEGKLIGLGFGFELNSPRDASTGFPTGRRQFKPVTFVKEWGAATPQILNALSTNENLTSVLFEFVKSEADGKSSVFQTVKLTDASVSDVTQSTSAIGSPLHEYETISLTFRKIEITNNIGKTTYQDDWSEPNT